MTSTVHVVVKLYQGILDDTVIFTDPDEAKTELENFIKDQGEDSEGSTIHEAQVINRKPIILYEWACDNCHSVFYTNSKTSCQCPHCESKARYCGKLSILTWAANAKS